ncbi:hypothetical protein NQ318_011455 [Aromia moschata]|uniref:Uncharacterized protein n=1 Tax=Aromia moschata TaxID=1265417 RepID=A0AAV8XB72_9CUCU|nr:hypothetical protein NQ318_011455 [Aromia moschata]
MRPHFISTAQCLHVTLWDMVTTLEETEQRVDDLSGLAVYIRRLVTWRKNGYCTSAGKTYPWRAVKRFISDNQGLVRRMYGDQRHGHVLKAELHNDVHLWNTMPLPVSRSSRYQHNADMGNDLFPNNLDTNENDARLLHEDVTNDVLNTKFVFSEEPPISIKLVGLKTGPHVAYRVGFNGPKSVKRFGVHIPKSKPMSKF